jgi:hypothetical protein
MVVRSLTSIWIFLILFYVFPLQVDMILLILLNAATHSTSQYEPPDNFSLQQNHCENLKSHKNGIFFFLGGVINPTIKIYFLYKRELLELWPFLDLQIYVKICGRY